MAKVPYTPADHTALIARVLNENSLPGASSAARLSEYANRLLTVNQHMNLTAITEPGAVALKHFADSLALLRFLPEGNLRLLDVGTGAGFPAVPLAIAAPSLRVVAMDSTAKRIAFLRACAEEMPIANLGGVVGRAEELGVRRDFRESFDIVTARAVARLSVLAELCLPFVKVGGRFLAMKSVEAKEEAEEAARGIARLGGKPIEIASYSLCLDGETIERSVVVIEKISPTPDLYPRPFAQINKKPLIS